MLIRGLTVDNMKEGIRSFLMPHFRSVLNPDVSSFLVNIPLTFLTISNTALLTCNIPLCRKLWASQSAGERPCVEHNHLYRGICVPLWWCLPHSSTHVLCILQCIKHKTPETQMAFKASLSCIFDVDFNSVCLMKRWREEKAVSSKLGKRLNWLILATLRLGWPQWVMHSTPIFWAAECWPPWGATTATTTTTTGQLSRNQTTSVSFRLLHPVLVALQRLSAADGPSCRHLHLDMFDCVHIHWLLGFQPEYRGGIRDVQRWVHVCYCLISKNKNIFPETEVTACWKFPMTCWSTN